MNEDFKKKLRERFNVYALNGKRVAIRYVSKEDQRDVLVTCGTIEATRPEHVIVNTGRFKVSISLFAILEIRERAHLEAASFQSTKPSESGSQ